MNLSQEIRQRAHDLGIAHKLDALPPCPHCGQPTTIINLTLKTRATLVCNTHACDGRGGFITALEDIALPFLSPIYLRLLTEVRDARRPVIASTLHLADHRRRRAIQELVARGLLVYHPPPLGRTIGGAYDITGTGLQALHGHR